MLYRPKTSYKPLCKACMSPTNILSYTSKCLPTTTYCLPTNHYPIRASGVPAPCHDSFLLRRGLTSISTILYSIFELEPIKGYVGDFQ